MESVDFTPDVRNLILAGLAAVESVLPHFQQNKSDPSEYIKESAEGLLSLLAELYQLRRFLTLRILAVLARASMILMLQGSFP